MRFFRVLFLCLLCAFVSPPSGVAHADGAQSTPQSTLRQRIDRLIKDSKLGTAIGVHAVRVSNGKVLYGNNANVKRNPASNIKLFTAAAALRELRPWHRFTTTLKGEKDGSHVANLVVVGGGDPTLGQMELLKIASRLKRLGVKSIGKISIDASYFDDRFLPPSFEQQPGETAAFRSPIAAFTAQGASYTVQIEPAAILGAKATIVVDLPSYIEIENETTTNDADHADLKITQRPLGKHRMVMRVEGILPIDDPPVTFPQRVLNPLAHAAYALSAALRTVGIKGKQCVDFEPPAQALPLLVEHRSDSLDDILKRLGKRSDNFTAEMLLKAMGKQEGIPASSAAALNVVRQQMKSIGVPVEQITLVNGSGLFNGNASTPRAFTTLLRRMALDPEVGPDFVAHLSISRGDGTLKRRKRLPAYVVRAKTGTLAGVVSLSGYILKKRPSNSIAFSILLNGVKGRIGKARKLADQIVNELSRQ